MSGIRSDMREAVALLRERASDKPFRPADARWLWTYLQPHTARAGVAGLLLLLVAGVSAVLPASTMYIIDRALPARDTRMINILLIALAVLYLLRPVASFLATYNFTVLGQTVQVRLREDLFRHLLKLPLAYFERKQTGYLVARLGEVSSIAILFSSAMLIPVLAVVDLLLSAGLMIWIDWRLTLIVSLTMPLLYLAARYQGRGVRASTRSMMEQGALVSKHLQESLSGVQTIKEHAAEERESQKIASSLKKLLRTGIVQGVAGTLASESMTLATGLVSLAVLWTSANFILHGTFTVGKYVAFSIYTLKFIGPLQIFATLSLGMQPALAGLRRLGELVDEVTEDDDPSRTVPLPRLRGQISMTDVRFTYEGQSREALNGVSMSIAEGEYIALVGPSGSGKTTLVRLLLGLYPVQEGMISIDDHDLRQVKLHDLRDRVGIVSQNVFLFNDTVRNNILYSRPGANDEDVIAAARAADAHEFIERLPNGYETIVGERGARLSGGQMQRISIARAVLKQPDVVIFDEATSQLDGESEQRVWREAERLFGDRTRIVISHRLSPVLAADRIVLLEAGRVVAVGTQEELLASSDRYRELFSITRTVEAAGGQAAGALLMGGEVAGGLFQSNKFRQAYARTCEILGVDPLPLPDSITPADLGSAATMAAEIAGRAARNPSEHQTGGHR
jgi:ABC-type bacteriocin/lantibiotic exporter with double-glycine peptidase domain